MLILLTSFLTDTNIRSVFFTGLTLFPKVFFLPGERTAVAEQVGHPPHRAVQLRQAPDYKADRVVQTPGRLVERADVNRGSANAATPGSQERRLNISLHWSKDAPGTGKGKIAGRCHLLFFPPPDISSPTLKFKPGCPFLEHGFFSSGRDNNERHFDFPCIRVRNFEAMSAVFLTQFIIRTIADSCRKVYCNLLGYSRGDNEQYYSSSDIFSFFHISVSG